MRTAVVLGASMAGLAAARVLSDHCQRVVVVDRDDLPDRPDARRLVPQGRQPHLLLPAGARLLEMWFPGLAEELYQAGAVEIDLCADFSWYQRGGLQRRPPSTLRAPAMSRPLLEWRVRRRVCAVPNVELRSNTAATGLITDDSGARITGVCVEDGRNIDCELVVDATGRSARSIAWLEQLGYASPPTSVVDVDTRYVTQVFRRADASNPDWQAAAVIDHPATKRLAMLLPMEDNRWIVAIAGVNGETAPTDTAGMLDYLAGMASPQIADMLAGCEPLGATATHRFPANQRRHVERLRRFPIGWLLLGDAVCSFNPIYGQGMSSAALQADALGTTLYRASSVNRAMTRSYFRSVARIVNAPWSIAIGGDFAYDGTRGRKPVGTDLLNRYFDRIVDAGQRDDAVVVRLNEVVALVRNPQTLLAPRFMLRVMRAARRVDLGRDAKPVPSPEWIGHVTEQCRTRSDRGPAAHSRRC